jgi:hypothetical protein
MSVESFIPQIWAASILRNFEKASVSCALCNRDYQGTVAQCGDMVKVPKIGPVAVRDYQKGGPITYDDVDGSTVDVAVDQQKYFAIKADDVDKMQSAPAFLDGATKNAAYALRDTVDVYTAGILAAGAGARLYEKNAWSSPDYVHLFALLAQSLDEQNVPRGGRWVVIPPFVVAGLTEAVIKAGMPNEKPISEGFIARIAGLDVYMSNNLRADAGGTRVIAGVAAAATHIMQLGAIETLRDQNSFSDMVRGLAVYTSAVLLPEGIVTALVEKPDDDSL